MDCIFYTQQSEDTGYTKAEQLFWTHVDHLCQVFILRKQVYKKLPRATKTGALWLPRISANLS